MTRPGRIAHGLSAAVIAAILAAGCATARTTGITNANLAERAAQARTPADHESLAVYFDERAAAAERRREELRQSRRSYERTPPSVFYPVGTAFGMLKHYDDLIESQQRNAESYRALADWHRQQGARQPSGAE